MTKVMVSDDCGSSPKNLFLQNITIAFASGDSEFILARVTDDVRWDIVGENVIQGKADFAVKLKQMKSELALELTIHHVATHGKTGAVNGTIKFKDGKTLSFCDVVEFSGAKGVRVKEITSYGIEKIRG